MNGFVKGMGMFELQPTRKRRKSTKERIPSALPPPPNNGGQDLIPKEYVMGWRGVSKAFHNTGNHMRHAILESNAREITPDRKVRLTTTDKKIADLFSDVSLKVMANGRTFVVTNDKSKAILLKKFSLQLTHDGKIRVIGKEE
jgi:hypothetical protein